MERLLIIEEGQERMFDISGRVVTVGRSSKSDVMIKDRNASRKHCNVLKVGDSWFVVDCDSQNGTLVNGERAKKKELKDGDKITIGSVHLVFLLTQNSPIPSLSQESEQKAPEINEEFLKKYPPEIKEEKKNVEDAGAEEKPLILQVPPPIEEAGNAIPSSKEECEEIEELEEILEEKKSDDVAPMAQEERAAVTSIRSVSTPGSSSRNIQVTKAIPMMMPTKKASNLVELEKNQLESDKGYVDLARVKECYGQFQERMSSVIPGQENMVRLFFIALLSGGHCLLSKSSEHSFLLKYYMMEYAARTLGLSFQSSFWHAGYKEPSSRYFLSFLDDHEKMVSLSYGNPGMIVLLRPRLEATPIIPVFLQPSFMFYFDQEAKSIEGHEIALLERYFKGEEAPISSADEILTFQQAVRQIKVSKEAIEYAVHLVRSTSPAEIRHEIIKEKVLKGCDSYTSLISIKAARTVAALKQRGTVLEDDIDDVAVQIIPPRLTLSAGLTFESAKTVYNTLLNRG